MRRSTRNLTIFILAAFSMSTLAAYADHDPPAACGNGDPICTEMRKTPPGQEKKSSGGGGNKKKQKLHGHGNEISGKHGRGGGHIKHAAPTAKGLKKRDGVPPGQAKKGN